MYTRCPNCNTHFEITQEYLDMANGKVRCGQCEHIFNALENLYEKEPEAESTPESETTQQAATNSTTDSLIESQVEKSSAEDSILETPASSDISFKEKMERIKASLSAATQELKTARETSVLGEDKPAQDAVSSYISPTQSSDSASTNQKVEQPVSFEAETHSSPEPIIEPEAEPEIEELESSVEEELDLLEPELIEEPEEELDLMEFNEESDETGEDSTPLTDFSTRKVDQDDIDILNSLIDASPDSDTQDQQADDSLLDELDDLNMTLSDEGDSIDDQLSSDSNELENIENTLDSELGDLENTLDNEFADLESSLDDDLDNGDDLLAELEQLEQDFIDNSQPETSTTKPDQEETTDENIVMETAEATPENTSSAKNKAEEEVVPSFLTQGDANPTNPKAMFGWLAGTIILLLTMAAQYLHVNSTNFAQDSTFRPILESLCPITGCALPLKKSPRRIVTVNHDVRTHPKINNALEIQLTFKNKANFTQGYPILEIIFSNPRGEVVARRQFLPDEYLTGDVQHALGIKKNQSQDIRLKIVDPDPSSLLSFQFNYL